MEKECMKIKVLTNAYSRNQGVRTEHIPLEDVRRVHMRKLHPEGQYPEGIQVVLAPLMYSVMIPASEYGPELFDRLQEVVDVNLGAA